MKIYEVETKEKIVNLNVNSECVDSILYISEFLNNKEKHKIEILSRIEVDDNTGKDLLLNMLDALSEYINDEEIDKKLFSKIDKF